jgi:hypothetical protein
LATVTGLLDLHFFLNRHCCIGCLNLCGRYFSVICDVVWDVGVMMYFKENWAVNPNTGLLSCLSCESAVLI